MAPAVGFGGAVVSQRSAVLSAVQRASLQQPLTMKNAQVFDDLPTWKQILFLPVEERVKVLRDAELRKKLRYEAVEEKKSSRFSRRWDLVYMIKAATLKNKYLEKKSVTEIAQIRG